MHKKKILVTCITTICLLIFIGNCSYVMGLDPLSIAETPDATGVSILVILGNNILGIIQTIGLGVATVATLVLAIRYMYSSPDDKAEIKKKLIPFIIGGVLVFGAVQLVKLVELFVGDISP